MTQNFCQSPNFLFFSVHGVCDLLLGQLEKHHWNVLCIYFCCYWEFLIMALKILMPFKMPPLFFLAGHSLGVPVLFTLCLYQLPVCLAFSSPSSALAKVMNTAMTGAGKMRCSAQTSCVFHPPGNCSFQSPPCTTELGGALLEKLTFEMWHSFWGGCGKWLAPRNSFYPECFCGVFTCACFYKSIVCVCLNSHFSLAAFNGVSFQTCMRIHVHKFVLEGPWGRKAFRGTVALPNQ